VNSKGSLPALLETISILDFGFGKPPPQAARENHPGATAPPLLRKEGSHFDFGFWILDFGLKEHAHFAVRLPPAKAGGNLKEKNCLKIFIFSYIVLEKWG
jgi:hypothetical protein